jgi:hypothetical protein
MQKGFKILIFFASPYPLAAPGVVPLLKEMDLKNNRLISYISPPRGSGLKNPY